MGSVHEGCRGCSTVFAAGRWVPWVLCTKAAPQSLLQVVGFHGFCARRLPHSLCCRSLGSMGSVHEGCRGCPTVFAAGHLVTWGPCTKAAVAALQSAAGRWVLCTKAAVAALQSAAGRWVLCTKAAVAAPQATADARGCRVEGMPAAHVLSCHAAAGLSLRRVFFLRTSSARGSGLAKANVRERTQSVGGLSGWLCSQGTSRRCDPPRSAGAVREDFAVVCQFKRRGRPRAGSQWRNTSLVLCGAAPLAFDVHLM